MLEGTAKDRLRFAPSKDRSKSCEEVSTPFAFLRIRVILVLWRNGTGPIGISMWTTVPTWML